METKKTKKPKQTSQAITTPEVKETPVVAPVAQQQQSPTQTSEPTQGETQTVQSQQPQQKEIRLVDISITDENIALNVIVGFLNVAHKRGVFTIDESAKIWECISKFQKP